MDPPESQPKRCRSQPRWSSRNSCLGTIIVIRLQHRAHAAESPQKSFRTHKLLPRCSYASPLARASCRWPLPVLPGRWTDPQPRRSLANRGSPDNSKRQGPSKAFRSSLLSFGKSTSQVTRTVALPGANTGLASGWLPATSSRAGRQVSTSKAGISVREFTVRKHQSQGSLFT